MRITPAIRIQGLTKYYGKSRGVEDISFEVMPGQIVGFVGPNGSGKTTVIRMLVGLLSISGGSAAILGRDVASSGPDIRSQVGYLPGSLKLYERMTAGKYLDFISKMRREDCSTRVSDIAERLTLDLSKPIGSMSKGTRQKVGVVQALMHDPQVLILDEPTSGLDPIVQRAFDDLLAECQAKGTAVLLSSHVMTEVERLADRLAIIDKGSLVAFDDVAQLQSLMTRTIVLEFATDAEASTVANVPGFTLTSCSGRHIVGVVVGSQRALLEAALRRDLVAVHSPEPSLDEVFARFVGQGQ